MIRLHRGAKRAGLDLLAIFAVSLEQRVHGRLLFAFILFILRVPAFRLLLGTALHGSAEDAGQGVADALQLLLTPALGLGEPAVVSGDLELLQGIDAQLVVDPLGELFAHADPMSSPVSPIVRGVVTLFRDTQQNFVPVDAIPSRVGRCSVNEARSRWCD